MNLTTHATVRMAERAITKREVNETLRAAKASDIRESWKNPGTFLVFGANNIVVVVNARGAVLTTYRETN